MEETPPKVPAIAIVGMAGRFPGARNPGEFWANLIAGLESISRFEDYELEGISPDPAEPGFVTARGILTGVEDWDASFWGCTPREAELMDPQHRLFLDCCWEALEDAGYDPRRIAIPVSVHAGCSLNTYLLHHVLPSRAAVESLTATFQTGDFLPVFGSDEDYLATRVSYKLNLRGPSMTVQSACSTSLVAVVQACQSLLTFTSDVALAGGVSITFPQRRGYLHQEGAIASADGRCRAFDADASGTVFGAGCGVVMLKRLEDAVADGDHLYALILGGALNNDGAAKVSFSAPSQEGQAEVIAMAHALAGVSAETISYIEAHGTGTPLGDPIEVAALTQAFRATTSRQDYCWLGSVKTNVGHLEAAAGVTGLIKTALALQHRFMPATLHFRQPNPNIAFAGSPFRVVGRGTTWEDVPLPRRAGVSSFGVGGTNAHVVLQEAPEREALAESDGEVLLVISARSAPALRELCARYAGRMEALAEQTPNRSAADVAFTLREGRTAFEHRCFVVAKDASDAVRQLRDATVLTEQSGHAEKTPPGIVFMFSGQGSQHVGMARDLYEREPVFRKTFDACCEALVGPLGGDLRAWVFAETAHAAHAEERLNQTRLAQPALVAVELALAHLWIHWGIEPAALVGHSVGEFTAAILAGVLPLEEGLRLVAQRGHLMQGMPPGSMLAVRLPEAEVRSSLPPGLEIAAVNAPRSCVVSGPSDQVRSYQDILTQRGIRSMALATSHAFHSAMMEPVLDPFREAVTQVDLSPARLPAVSTATGCWLEPGDWARPDYWINQLRQTVRFADAIGELVAEPARLFLEVGPGRALTQLVLQHPAREPKPWVISSLGSTADESDYACLLSALGRLWTAGVRVHWETFGQNRLKRRVSLPTYPFERQRYWIEPPKADTVNPAPRAMSGPGTGVALEDQILSQLEAMSAQLEALAARPQTKHHEPGKRPDPKG